MSGVVSAADVGRVKPGRKSLYPKPCTFCGAIIDNRRTWHKHLKKHEKYHREYASSDINKESIEQRLLRLALPSPPKRTLTKVLAPKATKSNSHTDLKGLLEGFARKKTTATNRVNSRKHSLVGDQNFIDFYKAVEAIDNPDQDKENEAVNDERSSDDDEDDDDDDGDCDYIDEEEELCG